MIKKVTFVPLFLLLTIYSFAQTPGGVGGGLTTWYKASSLGSAGVKSSWTESYTGETLVPHATYPDRKPSLHAGSVEMNFNPYLETVQTGASGHCLQKLSPSTNILGASGYIITVNGFGGGINQLTYRHWSGAPRYQLKGNRFGYQSADGSVKWQCFYEDFGTSGSSPILVTPTGEPRESGRAAIYVAKAGPTPYIRKNGIERTSVDKTEGALVPVGFNIGARAVNEYGSNRFGEIMTYKNVTLSETDLSKIESFLAVKYGITLGVNGTSKDYIFNDGTTFYSTTTSSGYNYDVFGIARDDVSGLANSVSHSVNGATVTSYNDPLILFGGSDFTSPVAPTTDKTAFMIGNDGGTEDYTTYAAGTLLANNITTGEVDTITHLYQRTYKTQQTGSIGSVSFMFYAPLNGNYVTTLSTLLGAAPTASQYRLLIDADGDFTSGAMSLAINSSSPDDIEFVTNYFELNPNHYFTLAYTEVPLILPVELAYFKGNKKDEGNLLKWESVKEVDTDYFELLYSTNGEDFYVIKQIDAKGTSSVYSYLHDQTGEKNFYKLRMVDKDGSEEESHVVELNRDAKVEVGIFPNPVRSKVKISSANYSISKVDILSIEGKVVFNQSVNDFYDTILDISTLSSGVYIVKVTLDNGEEYLQKITKR